VDALMLTWRLQRSEIVFVAAICLALTAVATWLAMDMRSILGRCGTPAATSACDVIFAFQETHGPIVSMTQAATGFVPFVAGLVLGVPIVTREVEQRTALTAWSLSRSRLRWLAWRAVPALVIGLALVSPLAFATDQMVRAYFPHSDIGFVQYEARGLPLVMRTAVMLVAGVAIGAVVGRLLPALLVGIAASVALSVGLGFALPHWAPSTLLGDLESPESGSWIGSQLSTEVRYRLPDGTVVSADDGEAFAEGVYDEGGGREPDPALLPEMLLYGIAPERYLEVAARETAALVSAVLVLASTAGFVVRRRRPE
jgi:hypothetical protein